jgi:YidC/Oxa1 family membrane protein insertase
MLKNNSFVGVAVWVAAIALLAGNGVAQGDVAKEQTAPAAPAAAVAEVPAPSQTPAPAAPPAPTEAPISTSASAAASAAAPAAAPAAPTATVAPAFAPPSLILENDSLRLHLTTLGGGIASAALLQHADLLANRKDPAAHPFLFNVGAPAPALAFRVDKGGFAPETWAPVFTVAENVPGKRVVLTAPLAQGLVVTRTYTLADPADPAADKNLVKTTTTFKNTSGTGIAAPAASPPLAFRLNTGTLPPTEGDTVNQFLGVSTYDGDTFNKVAVADFIESGGFLGLGAHPAAPYLRPVPTPGGNPWKWVSATNQYFAAIYRFAPAATDPRIHVTDLHVSPVHEVDPRTGLPAVRTATGDIGLTIPALAPGDSATFAADYYIGPREYTRLAKLGQGEEKTVQFSKLYFISVDFLCKTFTVILDTLHSLVPAGVANAWGFAIILLTILVKALTWPLVTAQQRSAERMRKFQGPMKAIREKFKDDQRRQQQEMMKLYKDHKINPFAGCLPVLVQIPIFTGLFFTFQSLAQLRFQSFLWIPDLSMPDVIPGLETIGGFPIHILPVFMGITMLANMRLTPMPNVEGQQKIIFYGMMVFFPVICYGMPSALMLYYSVQNVLTIFQTFHTRRRIRREDAATPAANAIVDISAKNHGKKKR